MATNTYVALDKVTVGTAVSSVTFSSIPSGYTDLVLVASGTCSAGSYLTLRFNSDTTTNYSTTELYGDGTTAGSVRNSNNNYMYIGSIRTTQSNIITQIQNYSNATTYKTVLSRTNNAATETKAGVGLWRATPAAITTIDVGTGGANTFQIGTTFSLYGIRAEGVSPAAKATGGTIYSDSLYYYHAFTGSGTFTPTQSITADCLIVGGGGGGNLAAGGAGGLRSLASQSLTTTGYTVTVGAGGTGSAYNATPSNGQDTSMIGTGFSFTGTGGGAAGPTDVGGGNGIAGGSGGAGAAEGARTTTGGAGNTPSTSPAQGFSGSGNNGFTASPYPSGAGGGAGGAGNAPASGTTGAVGGIGATSATINAMGAATGTGQLVSGNYYYAGGGGGGFASTGTSFTPGVGGSGGGGAGAIQVSGAKGGNGSANTGGGAGGSASGYSAPGASGGSGIVIVRYAK